MGLVQKDAFRTMLISYLGIILGYLNKGILFLLILTTEEIGLVNLLISVGMLFAQFANFGATFTIWKFLPFFRNQEKKHHGFFPFILLLVSIGIVLLTALSLIFRQPIEALYRDRSPLFATYYTWMIPIGIAYVLFISLEAYLRSFYKNIISVVALEIILRILVSITLLLLWLNWIDFNLFVIVNSLIYFVPTLILLVYLANMGELNLSWSSIRIPKKFRKIIFQYSSFYYVNTLGTVLVNSMDIIMIAQMIGLKATGVYSTVIFLSSALQVPYKSIIRISAPMIADYWKSRDFKQMGELYRKVSSVSLIIGLAPFLYIWSNIEFFFSFLKPEFAIGIPVFFYLMFGRLIDMWFGLNGSIFTTSKKYKYDIYFTIFLIFAIFLLNKLMIPEWGVVGAAISTSIALTIYNIGRMIFVWYTYKIHPFSKNQFLIILLGFVSFLLCEYTKNTFDHPWLQFLLQTTLTTVLFIVPIFIFSLEPETINYTKKVIDFIKTKTKIASPTPDDLLGD